MLSRVRLRHDIALDFINYYVDADVIKHVTTSFFVVEDARPQSKDVRILRIDIWTTLYLYARQLSPLLTNTPLKIAVRGTDPRS